MPTPNDYRGLIDKLRRKLLQQETRAVKDLIATYRGIYRNVQGNVDALTLAMEAIIKDGGSVSVARLRQMDQYRLLMAQTQAQLGKYGVYVETKLSAETYAALQTGALDAKTMTIYAANGSKAVSSAFRTLNPRVIENMTAFLAKDSPLFKNFQQYGNLEAKRIRDMIINDVALGKNPRVIAKDIINVGFGRPLADAIRTMRTAQLWSYREANILSYQANSDIVRGWIWNSVLDGDTCNACWALHGSVHDNTEMLDDHYNGHCYATPILAWEGDPTDTGLARFEALTDAEKAAILGPAKWEAYQAGRITFDQLAVQHDDATYGQMHVEASLQELLNET
jgi:hypothetical protein